MCAMCVLRCAMCAFDPVALVWAEGRGMAIGRPTGGAPLGIAHGGDTGQRPRFGLFYTGRHRMAVRDKGGSCIAPPPPPS
jgi:hypothetical protein